MAQRRPLGSGRATAGAGEWLNSRMAELRDNVNKAERAALRELLLQLQADGLTLLRKR